LERPTVLLISEDVEFSSAVPARWQREARVPAFTLMTGDLCQSFDPEIFDIAIVGKLPPKGMSRVIVLVGGQILQRCEAVQYAQRVAEAHASAQREATLGRYMLEMRHGVNNALTAMMGNAELLLMEAESLAPEVRLQVETIRNMSLRIHETMQRFSSLDKELNAVAKLTRLQSHASGA